MKEYGNMDWVLRWGMTLEEVEAILGKPEYVSKSGRYAGYDNSRGFTCEFLYGKLHGIIPDHRKVTE